MLSLTAALLSRSCNAVSRRQAARSGLVSLTQLQPPPSRLLAVDYSSTSFRRMLGVPEDGRTNPPVSTSAYPMPAPPPPEQQIRLGPNLTKYGVNLNRQVMEGKIDPVIGRKKEIERTIQVLSRRTKNNPCLIGEPGVGKTAIAEGLAQMICANQVPEWMKSSVVVSLDMASMLAGAKFRGEFEERLKGVLKDIESANDRIILFIDEIHVIQGAGGAEGSIDAGNILKPALARGQVRCLGATTIDEYKKHIEKDAALARRFQSILVSEPTIDETIDILRGLKEKYELYHGMIISDEAVCSAARLSSKYIADRRLPDKAVDLLDEACSKIRVTLETVPDAIKIIDAEIANIMKASSSSSSGGSGGGGALKKDSVLSPETTNATLMQLNLKKIPLMDKWRQYKSDLKEINKIKQAIAQLKLDQFICQKLGNYDRVKYIEEIELRDSSKELETKQASFIAQHFESDDHVLKPIHIAEIVKSITGIPVGSLLDRERKSLLNMEQELCSRVVGQEEAISSIARCIRLSRAGLKFHDRPLGVFLMLGSTGVGKTEVAKALCEYLFHDENAILRVDMSEYMERFSVSRLVGAPPGYVGYDEGGTLTESVRTKPYQVILLDEFEKAHRDVSNLLLQVFDEGRLSDSKGKLVDFRNTVIIMTSNLIQADMINKKVDSDSIRQMVSEHFAPEFVNRLDEIVVFNNLTKEVLLSITHIQLKKVSNLLLDRGITLKFSNKLIDFVAEKGFDKNFGARPLKRYIQAKILDPLAYIVLEESIGLDDTVFISLNSSGSNSSSSSSSSSSISDAGNNNHNNDNDNEVKNHTLLKSEGLINIWIKNK